MAELGMDAKIQHNGYVITVPISGLAEALRQLDNLKASAPLQLPAVRTQGLQLPQSRPSLERFLRLLADHEKSGGVSPDEVQVVLGADHPKGIGSKMTLINNDIKGRGFEPADIYSNERRDPLGRRVWEPGPKLAELLKVVDEDF